jgi:septum site-determining protein MinC
MQGLMDTGSTTEKEASMATTPRQRGDSASRESSDLGGDAGLVVARGTKEGLVLRLDISQGLGALEDELRDFLVVRHRFVSGQEVVVDWVNGLPSEMEIDRIQDVVLRDFEVRVRPVREVVPAKRSPKDDSMSLGGGRTTIPLAGSIELNKELTPQSLFSGVGVFDQERAAPLAESTESVVAPWDDANAKVVCSTLRSGQRVESEHTVVVLGDVNSGAEVVSGGHVVVLGSLRGLAHAGAFEESDGPAFIVALSLQPTQLRIGSVISRSNGRAISGESGPEIARVDGDLIVVEKYHPRVIVQRGGRG